MERVELICFILSVALTKLHLCLFIVLIYLFIPLETYNCKPIVEMLENLQLYLSSMNKNVITL